MMITREQAIEKINEINAQYLNREISRNKQLSRIKKVQSEFKNRFSVSTQVKEFGAKVKKEFGGYYIYQGLNFTAKFNEESCETTWWEVNILDDDTNAAVENAFNDFNYFYTKKEVLSALLQLDKDIQHSK